MKKTLMVIVAVVIALVTVGICKDVIIKSVATIVISQVTGAPTHIDWFSVGILKRNVQIDGLKMYNPPGFPKGVLVDIPKIYIDYSLGEMLRGKIHLIKAEFALKEIDLVKNSAGKLNVDALKVSQQGAKPKDEKEKKPAKQLQIQMDIFKLNIGQLVYKDFSAGGEPSVKAYDININKAYKNITSVEQLVALILSEPMKAAGIKGAEIYGAVMLTGVAILPVGLAVTLVGKDSAQQDFSYSFDRVYAASVEVLKQLGKINKENKENGQISAQVRSSSVAVRIEKMQDAITHVVISARQYLLPKPEVAGGILYQIAEQLKK